MRIPTLQRSSTAPDTSTMTPMIDVVFLLLIFFICASARQVREALLPAALPPGAIEAAQAVAPATIDQAFVKIKRPPDGPTSGEINGTEYATLELLEQQLAALAEIAPEVPVVLDIDGPVPFGDVIQVYDACQRLKFTAIKFAIDLKRTR